LHSKTKKCPLIMVRNQRAKILDYLSQNISKKKIRPDIFQKLRRALYLDPCFW
jgi:hypothetical protein